MNALEIIKDSIILKDNDWLELYGIKDELYKTWETVQIFRTRTEMKVSVLNDLKRPTPDAKYWQAIREQNVMFTELVNLSYEYRKKLVEIKKLERNLLKETDDLEKELLRIEIEQNNWQIQNMERIAHDRIREILEWSAIKKELLPHLKYGNDDVNAHQFESLQISFNLQSQLVNEQTAIADAQNVLGLASTINRVIGEQNKELTY